MTEIDKCIKLYNERSSQFGYFLQQVEVFFNDPFFKEGVPPLIHSTKKRLKDPEHLRDKLYRKKKEGRRITSQNFFSQITDFAGIRVLHIYQKQFVEIHNKIMEKIRNKEWLLVEPPTAYSWDPEAKDFFEKLKIRTKIKDSYYTSVHYIVKPNNNSEITCEVQVRTLFEEIWGEIDHSINYPHPTKINSCKEELRVLSKLVSTGTRLADTIFKNFNEGSTK